MVLVDRVRRFIRQHDLIGPATRVVAAVSGGSDSTALVHILKVLADAGELQLAGIAHFNHELRPAADADQRFVEDLAASLGLTCFDDREDIRARAAHAGQSIELAARTARYEFYDRARRHFSPDGGASGAEVIALGHTRDDQAETVLLRLIRGAGPRGLSGMHPRNGALVRPLLGCRRQELRAWLAERQLPFVEDETNADVSIPRNRVRAELLPLLESRFNPGVVDVLADQAELARDAAAWIDGMVVEIEERIVRRARTTADAPVCEIDVAGLRAAPPALQRALLWRLMREVAGVRPIAFGHIEAARRLIEGTADSRIDLPGQRVERIGAKVVLTGRAAGAQGRESVEAPSVFRFPLSIPGEVVLSEAGWVVSADTSAGAIVSNASGANIAQVRFDLCRGSLAVRNRRPGDRFHPVGLDGQKKLQDYFVDRKVARNRRDSVPLVVDDTDRIVWVAGFGIDEAFRVTDPAQAVIILKLRQA